MHWFHYVGKFLTRLVLFLFTRWKVTGGENVPPDGAVLVVANHLNMMDPPIVGVSLGRTAIFMAKAELFRSPLSRFFVANFGAFPVRRGGFDRDALQQAQTWLGRGFAVVMFPEGRRGSGPLQPAFPGSALIASRMGVPILPVGLAGTESLNRFGGWLRRPAITVNIGQPFRLPAATGRRDRDELQRQTDFIMDRIARLLPPEYGKVEK